jgi:hypothetical protein
MVGRLQNIVGERTDDSCRLGLMPRRRLLVQLLSELSVNVVGETTDESDGVRMDGGLQVLRSWLIFLVPEYGLACAGVWSVASLLMLRRRVL